MVRIISLYLMVFLYVAAGINHFVHPTFYLSIIPVYLPFHFALNGLAGMAEMVFGVFLIFPSTRKFGAVAIMLLLFLFIPVHVYMINKAVCTGESICRTKWLAWVRLFPIQFLLIGWAWWHTKKLSQGIH